jgi:HEAT repeat protein
MGPAASAAVPALVEALKDADERLGAARTLATIALMARDARATHMIIPLKDARNAFLTLTDPRIHDHAATVSWVIEFLELLWWKDLREKLWQWMDEHRYPSAGIAVYASLLLCWLALHWLRPLWLYRINEALKPYTDFALPAQLGGIKIPLRYVLLVGFFHYSRRMLDAWITQHLTIAREAFQRRATVSHCAVHIAVPVVLDGQAIPHLTAEHLRPMFSKNRVCLLICGEGGAGKTSLACQVARCAMADRPVERLCPQHRMLPVLIEQALELKDKDHPHPFADSIRGELRALTYEEEPIPEEFLLRLLQRRRILVVVDHLSEMPDATRQEIRPGQPEFPANALIITSRLEEQLGGVPPTIVKPLRIQGNRLSSFLEAYLTQRDKRDYFDDAEFFEACRRLSVMVGTREITVLLAKLYAEQMIAAKEDSALRVLPDTIPDLMLSYVNEVNRGIDRPKQEDRTVHRVAKVIAWECLKRTYRPTPAPREDMLAALRWEQDAEALLSYLENRLRLIQTVGAGRNQIRFALDPLAEYLPASMSWSRMGTTQRPGSSFSPVQKGCQARRQRLQSSCWRYEIAALRKGRTRRCQA